MFEGEPIRDCVAREIRPKAVRYFLLGVGSVVLGSVGVLYAGLVTLTSVIVFGVALMLIGAAHVVQAARWRDAFGLWVQVPMGLLEFVVGALLLWHPFASIPGLTLLLSAFFVVAGLYRAFFAIAVQFPSWGWHALSGAVSVGLGTLAWWEWPRSSSWMLGTYVCLYLIATGWSFVMLGVAALPRSGPRPRPAV